MNDETVKPCQACIGRAVAQWKRVYVTPDTLEKIKQLSKINKKSMLRTLEKIIERELKLYKDVGLSESEVE